MTVARRDAIARPQLQLLRPRLHTGATSPTQGPPERRGPDFGGDGPQSPLRTVPQMPAFEPGQSAVTQLWATVGDSRHLLDIRAA